MRLLERPARRSVALLDGLATRAFGTAWNPFHQTGTVAVAMLLVLTVTGLDLVFFYRLAAPYASVVRLQTDPWLGAWIRTLHRYASGLFVAAGALHALRLFAQERSWGPRTLAWISGLVIFGAGLICAWTGYVMVWDTFGERLAREGARLFDALPVLSEPLGRIFAGEQPVPSAFFFVNLFVHIALPLGLGVGLWLHVSRVARPTLLPPRRLLWAIVAALVVGSVVLPASLGPSADPFGLAPSTPSDLLIAWWLPISERLSPGVVWAGGLAAALAAVLVPRFTRRRREASWAPSQVDSRLCTGCDQCTQDCPWEAITMVERDDGRATLLARVDASRCVSCGICAGSCAPMGIGPPGRTGRDQLAPLRDDGLVPPGPTPASVAICCERVPSGHLTALAGLDARIHRVPCVGNLHSSVVELLLRQGAPGVVICGCPPRDCVGREGPKWLEQRLFAGREAELQPRVDRRRIALLTLAPGNRAEAVAAIEAHFRRFAALEPTEPLPAGELGAVCDPVSVEEAVS
ncbi:MAG: hydrogenase iron-sulfur subunit [Gemmatimonadales bacterium]